MAGSCEMERFEAGQDLDTFICSVCQCVVDRPVTIPCKHLFCRTCIKNWIMDNESCPLCRRPSTLDEIRLAPLSTREKLWQLRVRCCFHGVGCPEVVVLKDLKEHERHCNFRIKRCQWKDCKHPLIADEEEEEEDEEAGRRRKKLCCSKTCMINATMDKYQHRVVTHRNWTDFQQRARNWRTANDAKREIERFERWVAEELQFLDAEITQRINAEFAAAENAAESRDRWRREVNHLYGVVQSHASRIFPHVDFDFEVDPRDIHTINIYWNRLPLNIIWYRIPLPPLSSRDPGNIHTTNIYWNRLPLNIPIPLPPLFFIDDEDATGEGDEDTEDEAGSEREE